MGLVATFLAAKGVQAQNADPLFFPPTESDFVFTVHGCSGDRTMMELRYAFGVDPLHMSAYLTPDDDGVSLMDSVKDYTAHSLLPLWQEKVAGYSVSPTGSVTGAPEEAFYSDLQAFADAIFPHDVPVEMRGGIAVLNHEDCASLSL